MRRLVLSADPGSKGAIALLDHNMEVVDVIDMPMRYFLPRKKRDRKSKYLADGKTLRKKLPPLKQDPRRVFDGVKLKEWIEPYLPYIDVAVIEQVSSRTSQGSKSIFKFGEVFGSLKAFLEALGINYHLVQPKQWQEFLNISADDKEDLKIKILHCCESIYPDVTLRGPAGGIKDGRSDAILIGRYFIESRREGTLKTIGVPPWPCDQSA